MRTAPVWPPIPRIAARRICLVSDSDPECLSPAGVVLPVIMGQVEIPVGAVEYNDVEVRDPTL